MDEYMINHSFEKQQPKYYTFLNKLVYMSSKIGNINLLWNIREKKNVFTLFL